MANERDNEIWDDATNAVCQAMQEQKMCNCPDGGCLAAKVDFSPEKIATSNRPAAPVEGLEVVGIQHLRSVDGKWHYGEAEYINQDERELVTRSQAEAIIAAKVEQERLRFEGELDKWMKIIGTGITGYQPEAYALMDLACQGLVKLRADNVAKDAELKAAREHGDMWFKDYSDLRETFKLKQVENAALTARVKELEQHSCDNGFCNTDHWYDQAKALETQLAAARKALESAAYNFDDIFCTPRVRECKSTVDQFDLVIAKAGQFGTEARAALEDRP